MTAGDKYGFFLKHREQLAEWFSLADQFASDLDSALVNRLADVGSDKSSPRPSKSRTGRNYKLHVESVDGSPKHAWVEMNWERSKLVRGEWPAIAVVWNKEGSTAEVRSAVKAATASACADLGLTHEGTPAQYWIWWSRPAPGVTEDLDAYANACVDRFVATWTAVHAAIGAAIAETV